MLSFGGDLGLVTQVAAEDAQQGRYRPSEQQTYDANGLPGMQRPSRSLACLRLLNCAVC